MCRAFSVQSHNQFINLELNILCYCCLLTGVESLNHALKYGIGLSIHDLYTKLISDEGCSI